MGSKLADKPAFPGHQWCGIKAAIAYDLVYIPPDHFGGRARGRFRAASAFVEPPLPITSVYVDGFNLFYGALRKPPHRWLDIDRLCRLLLPNNDI